MFVGCVSMFSFVWSAEWRKCFWIIHKRPYLVVTTMCLDYKDEAVGAVSENNHRLLWESYGRRRAKSRCLDLQVVGAGQFSDHLYCGQMTVSCIIHCAGQTYLPRFAASELNFCFLFCMGVKLGHSHWGRNVGRGCLKIRSWEYLGLRGTRWQGSGENYIMRCLNFRCLTSTIADVPQR